MVTRLDDIEARAKAATLGPWEYHDYGMVWAGEVWIETQATDDDWRFIAAAREDIPYLLRIARAAEAWLEARNTLDTEQDYDRAEAADQRLREALEGA